MVISVTGGVATGVGVGVGVGGVISGGVISGGVAIGFDGVVIISSCTTGLWSDIFCGILPPITCCVRFIICRSPEGLILPFFLKNIISIFFPLRNPVTIFIGL